MTAPDTFYVTTPIYYVNAHPHLGHTYTTVIADMLSRYHRLKGSDTFFLTGTDEHGTKIASAAAEAGMEPQAFTDQISQRFRDLLPLVNAEPDFFIRTTDAGHEAFVAAILKKLKDNDDIYEADYSGPYCEACEEYYRPEDLLEGGLCPTHKTPVATLTETNYFFRLSKYEDRLRTYYEDHPDLVWPKSRYNESLSFINQGLDDFSMSRTSITWGVPIPWDTDHVTYVWVDALFNYMSALTYARDEDLVERYWPPTVQLLAKDILRFHAISWPALLMALDLPLPEKLAIHGYLLVDDEKMSKTQGNVFDPFELIETYGADPLRFYLIREVQFGQDGAVSMEGFENRYQSELANDLGNLVSRSAAMTVKYLDGKLPTAPESSAVRNALDDATADMDRRMEALDLSGALEAVWQVVRQLNKHVEDTAPWVLAKDPQKGDELAATLSELAEGCVGVARLLSVFMPEMAPKIAAVFGVGAEELAQAGWGSTSGVTVQKPEPLFPRIELASV